MTFIRVIGELDPNFAWDGASLCEATDLRPGLPLPAKLRGAMASVQCCAGGWRIIRDPLGINKLFWAHSQEHTILMAARPSLLVGEGCSFEQIRAIPRGAVIDFRASERVPVQRSLIPSSWSSPTPPGRSLEVTAHDIRETLEQYLSALAKAHRRAPSFVCLSGGLDSSGIAVLARRHFPDLIAVSFDLVREDGSASEDRRTAQRLAEFLKLPLLEATVTQDELFAELDTVLIEGIDWRDFNVHAGLVNAALAKAIAKQSPGRDPSSPAIVLTGDLANEFLVDYHPETYHDKVYYNLPSLSPVALRSSLLRGLDTSHREIGVFRAWNLSVVQPYAVAVDAYLSLSSSFLSQEQRKEQLCRAIFGALLPDYIYSRPKARAQVGGLDVGRGVLAASADRGVDMNYLKDRFAHLQRVEDVSVLDRFMRAGVYRSAVPAMAGAVS